MKWMGWLLGTTVILLIGVGVRHSQREHGFTDLKQAQACILGAGFRCTSDVADGRLATGFLISRDSVSWQEVGRLPKTGNLGRKWQGKVWITINPACFQLGSMPDQAGARRWGELIAFGDEDLLSEIDQAIQHS